MSLTINTNLTALGLGQQVNKKANQSATSAVKLSTGLKITGAQDDAAGLAIANGLKLDLATFRASGNNIAQATSLLQVTDGALQQLDGLTQRLQSLATTAQSGQLSDTERGYVNTEFQNLLQEFDRVAGNAEFGGNKLLSGGSLGFQVGGGQGDQLSVALPDVSTTSLGLNSLNVADSTAAAGAADALKQAQGTLNTTRTDVNASLNRLEYAGASLAVQAENVAASASAVQDANTAEEITRNTIAQVGERAGVALLAQSNQKPSLLLQLLGSTS